MVVSIGTADEVAEKVVGGAVLFLSGPSR